MDAGARESEPRATDSGRTWERFPNPDFRNKLAMAEQSDNTPNFGYGDVNPQSHALGRYQMTAAALRAAGMIDSAGNWTGRYGVHPEAQFLASPEAQEKALTDYLNDIVRQLRAEMLRDGHWRRSPQFHQVMLATAAAARVDLKGNGPKHVIFVMTDFSFCGTAGCSMLIGEERHNGTCHEVYDGSASPTRLLCCGNAIMATALYTPCELRFDGHEYQQIHEECPTIDVQR